MPQRGNPRCPDCEGKGVVRTDAGWRPCGCVRGTRSQHKLMRQFNTGDRPFVPLSERMRQ